MTATEAGQRSEHHRVATPKPAPPLPPPDGAQLAEGVDLVRFIFGGCDGYIGISRMTGTRLATDCFATDDIQNAIESAAAHANHFNVYLRTSTLSEPLRKGRRGTAAQTLHLPFFHLDIDGAWGSHAAADPEAYPATIDEALSALEGFPHPSAIVLSGGGVYPIWRLSDPIEGNEAALPVLRMWNDQWQARFAELGWHLDNTASTDRLLRWPGTMNRKTDPARPVELMEISGATYHLADLVPEMPADDGAPEPPPSRERNRRRTREADDPAHPFDAVRTHEGQRFVANELTNKLGWEEVGAGPNEAIDLLRPPNDRHGPPSSGLSARLGGRHPGTGDDMTGQAHVFWLFAPIRG